MLLCQCKFPDGSYVQSARFADDGLKVATSCQDTDIDNWFNAKGRFMVSGKSGSTDKNNIKEQLICG